MKKIIARLRKIEVIEYVVWYSFIFSCFAYVIIILYFVPLYVTIGILVVIGLTKLSRFAFGIKGKLKKHIDDSEARSK